MTNTGCEQFGELCCLVAAGAATPEEERAFQNHLTGGCTGCSGAHRELMETAALLAGALPPVAPPSNVREKLLNAIEMERAVAPGGFVARPPQRGAAGRFTWLWATGWALAAAMGLMLFLDVDMQRKKAQRFTLELEAVRNDLEEKGRTLAETEATLRLVQARQTQLARLAGLPPSPAAVGKVFWNPQDNAGILIVFDLPPLPQGKIYQLWAIQGSAPVDAGIFSPDPQGTSSLKVKPLPDPGKSVQLFAITIEPAGGSPQPTGEMYLRGAPVTF
jgi:hypothetical protein